MNSVSKPFSLLFSLQAFRLFSRDRYRPISYIRRIFVQAHINKDKNMPSQNKIKREEKKTHYNEIQEQEKRSLFGVIGRTESARGYLQ